ncbi:MAG: GIY-YIG nuclease family protein, partial [Ignavibacteriales bacterium]|nr:GIY-YIG nuclease family protein [Ignavibacteriales bacterium]
NHRPFENDALCQIIRHCERVPLTRDFEGDERSSPVGLSSIFRSVQHSQVGVKPLHHLAIGLSAMAKPMYVYILTNQRHTVLYTGVTNDLERRLAEHRSKENRGFTYRYNVTKLVYFEEFDNPDDAIQREKQIKAGSRQKKLDLINGLNPGWRDLAEISD